MKLFIVVWMYLGFSLANAAQPIFLEVPDTLEERVKPCTLCHGDIDRTGQDAYYPRIAGKPAGYLFNQLRNFRDGRRYYQPMAILLENMSDEYMQEIAHYFAALPYVYPQPKPRAMSSEQIEAVENLINKGDSMRNLPACSACHGDALMGVEPFIPGLLGLPHAYLAAQFGGWRHGGIMRGQIPDCMSEIANKLTQYEVNALVMWLPGRPVAGKPAQSDTLAPEMVRRCQHLLSEKEIVQ
ncbi:c-type cytochrome [Nitrosomonas sp. ANs5]|uniref:c-type cytochrome n=1 Tax=Nitrosomonas sp. ANs5 TaxID=3423941 RepID=UPI003D335FCA